MIIRRNNDAGATPTAMIGMESLPTAYDEAVEMDARRIQEAGPDPDANPIHQYMIERGWYDKFTSFKNDVAGDGKTSSHPGKLLNSQLLACASDNNVTNDSNGNNGDNDGVAIEGLVPMNEDSNSDDEERRRQLRRKKWQDKERDFKTSEQRPELLGGNNHPAGSASLSSPLSSPVVLRPNLRHQTDYVLVGEKAWNVISKNFPYDVEIPRRLCYDDDKRGGSNGASRNPWEKKSLVVDIYPETNAMMDEGKVVVPPSGRWGLTNVVSKDASDVEGNRSSVSDLISEGSSPAESGDDLFPYLEREQVMLSTPQSPSSENQLQIVPFELAKSSVSDLYAKRSKLVDVKSDVDTSDDDAGSPICDDQEEVRSSPTKRKRATGLGNLGNTCFMNSTLQCLAHTAPLREYFVSGAFRKDLNTGNPLGTGGELATEFASLLRQMWGVRTEDRPSVRQYRSTVYSSSRVCSNYDSGYSSVTYPRTFKLTLGRHAEQFMGYDQHDSQELAIYLLDALHEDTNRVTKKPYIEKTEQAEDESDDVAAEKAWNLHLQRENSRILENFMGQIKSRLTCPAEGCGRVSTTFDPFMYLSVPIPGAMDRVLKVTFVPLHVEAPLADLTVKLNKMSTIADLRLHVAVLARECYQLKDEELLEEDIQLADIWSGEVYCFYDEPESIEKIRDRDVTFAYQLRPLSSVKQEAAAYREQQKKLAESSEKAENDFGLSSSLDSDTKDQLDTDDKWQNALEGFVEHPMSLYRLLNESRSTKDEKIDFYRKLIRFIQGCRNCSDSNSAETDNGALSKAPAASLRKIKSDDSTVTLEEKSETSRSFKNVRTPEDLAILEYCAFKYNSFINGSFKKKKTSSDKGIVVQVVFKKQLSAHCHNPNSRASWKTVGMPIIVRVAPNQSVSDFRTELGRRLSKALKSDVECNGHRGVSVDDARCDSPLEKLSGSFSELSPETTILRQVALSYEMKPTSSHQFVGSKVIGAVTDEHLVSGTQVFAKPSDKEEKKLIAEILDNEGKIFVGWPTRLNDSFDEDELDIREEFLSQQQKEDEEKSLGNKVTVMDCISKYCQVEQLEKSEMWYCNRCKDHVQAWKKFCLYSTPPILIIHLKRFHFSSSTHRRDKIDTLIDFPLTDLDLRDFVMHKEEGQEPIYDCYAVSNHFGGLGGGHYTAYAKGDDGSWFNFDDSRVTSVVDESEVVSKAAYCLYYKRKDVVFDNDKEIEDLSKGLGSKQAMVGSPDDATSNEDMEVDNGNQSASPSPCSSYEYQLDDSMDEVQASPIPQIVADGDRATFPLQ